MTYFSDFADEFFFSVAAVVTLFSFVDWLLGENRRRAMRQQFGNFAERLESIRYKELFVEDIQLIKAGGDKLFGPSFFSIRRFVSVFVAVLSIVFFALFVRAFYYPITVERSVFKLTEGPAEVLVHTVHLSDLAHRHLEFFIVNFVIFMATLSITLLMLKLATRASSVIASVLFLVLDCVMIAVQVLPLLYVWIVIFVVTNIFASSKASVVGSTVMDDSLVFIFVPSVAYILVLLVRMFSKAARKVVIPIVTLFLVRFEESKKGVLTNIAVGLGVSVKLAQQFVKSFA